MKKQVANSQPWLKAGVLWMGLIAAGTLVQAVPAMAEETTTANSINANLDKAKALYEQAVQYMVNTKDANANQQNIVDLLTQSANLGYAPAQVDLGKVYYFGLAGNRDDNEALVWFKKAAEQGDAKGQYHLGQMYTEGKGGLKESEKEASEWYEKSATQGYAPAQYYLAILYLAGIDGIEKDQSKALDLLQKAAAQGNKEAVDLLGKLQPSKPAAATPQVQ